MTNDDYKTSRSRPRDPVEMDAAVETAAEIIVALLVAAVSYRLISHFYSTMHEVIAGIWGTHG